MPATRNIRTCISFHFNYASSIRDYIQPFLLLVEKSIIIRSAEQLVMSVKSKQLPPGQRFIKNFIYYAALGLPEVDIASYRLRVFGNVSKPQAFTYQQLLSLSDTVVEKDFHCVTGWSIADARWEGASLSKLITQCRPLADTEWVLFHSLDGYTAPVTFQDAMEEDSIVAFRLNGKELTREMGYPARPIIPKLYGWKSAKWLDGIELLKDYRDGYWEERGYNERGNVWYEERFKSWGRHLPRSPVSSSNH